MNQFAAAITVHPEIQDGAPVFSGTRIGVSVNEFLDEFPSITRDQALEVYDLMNRQYTPDQIAAMAINPQSNIQPGEGRMYAAA
jgi:uncharacterized protein (DUF433 family)